jgi:hypothetical protein
VDFEGYLRRRDAYCLLWRAEQLIQNFPALMTCTLLGQVVCYFPWSTPYDRKSKGDGISDGIVRRYGLIYDSPCTTGRSGLLLFFFCRTDGGHSREPSSTTTEQGPTVT